MELPHPRPPSTLSLKTALIRVWGGGGLANKAYFGLSTPVFARRSEKKTLVRIMVFLGASMLILALFFVC